MRTHARLMLALAALLCFRYAATVQASDHRNLDRGLPTLLEDAYPTAYKNREFQEQLRYEFTDAESHHITLAQRLEYGLLPNAEASLVVPVELGNAVRDNLGDIEAEFFYNFINDSLVLPAISLSGTAILPTAPASEGVDMEAELVFSKKLFPTSWWNTAHVNLAWKKNFGTRAGERQNGYRLVVGHSMRLGSSTVSVIDYVLDQEKVAGRTSQFAEAGLRRQITPLMVLGVGIGAGLDDDSPRVRGTLSFQHAF